MLRKPGRAWNEICYQIENMANFIGWKFLIRQYLCFKNFIKLYFWHKISGKNFLSGHTFGIETLSNWHIRNLTLAFFLAKFQPGLSIPYFLNTLSIALYRSSITTWWIFGILFQRIVKRDPHNIRDNSTQLISFSGFIG